MANRFRKIYPTQNFKTEIPSFPAAEYIALSNAITTEYNRRQDNFNNLLNTYSQFVSRSSKDMETWNSIVGEYLNPLIEELTRDPDAFKNPMWNSKYSIAMSGLAMRPELNQIKAASALYEEKAKAIATLEEKGQYDRMSRDRSDWDFSNMNSLDPATWQNLNLGARPVISQDTYWSTIFSAMEPTSQGFGQDPTTGIWYYREGREEEDYTNVISYILASNAIAPQQYQDWATLYSNLTGKPVESIEDKDFQKWLTTNAAAIAVPYIYGKDDTLSSSSTGNYRDTRPDGDSKYDGSGSPDFFTKTITSANTNAEAAVDSVIQGDSRKIFVAGDNDKGISQFEDWAPEKIYRADSPDYKLMRRAGIEPAKLINLSRGEYYNTMQKYANQLAVEYNSPGATAAFKATAEADIKLINKRLSDLRALTRFNLDNDQGGFSEEQVNRYVNASATGFGFEDQARWITSTNADDKDLNIYTGESQHGLLIPNKPFSDGRQTSKLTVLNGGTSSDHFEISNNKGQKASIINDDLFKEKGGLVGNDRLQRYIAEIAVKRNGGGTDAKLGDELQRVVEDAVSKSKTIYVIPSSSLSVRSIHGKKSPAFPGVGLITDLGPIKKAVQAFLIKRIGPGTATNLTEDEVFRVEKNFYEVAFGISDNPTKHAGKIGTYIGDLRLNSADNTARGNKVGDNMLEVTANWSASPTLNAQSHYNYLSRYTASTAAQFTGRNEESEYYRSIGVNPLDIQVQRSLARYAELQAQWGQ
jgi:hypothetical protein